MGTPPPPGPERGRDLPKVTQLPEGTAPPHEETCSLQRVGEEEGCCQKVTLETCFAKGKGIEGSSKGWVGTGGAKATHQQVGGKAAGRAGGGGRSEEGAKSVVCELGTSHAQRLSQEPQGQGRAGAEGSARRPRCLPSWGHSGCTTQSKGRASLSHSLAPCGPRPLITAQGPREATLGKNLLGSSCCDSFIGLAPCSCGAGVALVAYLGPTIPPPPRVLSEAGGDMQAFYLPAWCFLIARSGLSRGSGQSGELRQTFIIIVIIFTTNNPG